jgi:hypothetical protein
VYIQIQRRERLRDARHSRSPSSPPIAAARVVVDDNARNLTGFDPCGMCVRIVRQSNRTRESSALSSQKVDDVNATFRGIQMATRRTRRSKSFTVKSMELALSVPQVYAHRLTRMALAGRKLSDRDRKEFQIMVNEKHAAFAQAWSDMAMHAFRANQAFTASMLRFFFAPLSHRKPSAASTAARLQNAAIGVLGKGLAPIHRKAVSNARRLAKTRLC